MVKEIIQPASHCTPSLIAGIRQHWARSTDEPRRSANSGALSGSANRTLAGFGKELPPEREMAVARLVLRGSLSGAIAELLVLSLEPVKVQRRNLYDKLGFSTQPELHLLFTQAPGHEAG
jgi:DNA-binding NarL/FixJ family response regulator